MPLKDPNLRVINAAIPVAIYEWMEESIKEGRYVTKAEIVRQALFELKHRKETTLTSYGT